MRRAALLALAVVVALTATADARCMKKGCRKMNGPHATARSVAPMIAAGLQAATAPGQVTPPPGDTSPPAGSPAPASVARLGVVAREWSLVLSRSTLPAGRARVQLQNFGEDAHNLRIESVGASLDVPLAESGEVQAADGTLPAGDYKVYCTLPGHEAQGMRARLTVTP
jgi:plastocyanin